MVMTTSVICAALPVYNARLEVIAHELLFRDKDENKADFTNADSATCDVLLNAFTGICSTNLTDNDNPVFITLTRNLLDSGVLPSKFQQRIIYKYSAKSGLSADTLARLSKLNRQGYRFALCDIEHWQGDDQLLVDFHFLKFNTQSTDIKTLAALVSRFKNLGPKLIAEKIEQFTTMHQCTELGFDAYQGFFLTEPRIIKGHKLDSSTQVIFKLIQELQNPDTTAERVEKVICQDAALSYKLFRVLNSAAMALPRKISTIKEAVVVLGFDQLTEWATLIAFSNLQIKSDALFHLQMVRAAMCERLAKAKKYKNSKQYFLAGMFSCLNALLDVDMDYLLSKIPLDDSIAAAILTYEGSIGEILQTVICFEHADWDNVSDDEIGNIYLNSLQWANSLLPAFLPRKNTNR